MQHTPIRMAEIWNTNTTKCWLGCAGETHLLLVEMQNGIASVEDNLALLNKTKHAFTVWSATAFLYPKGVENLCERRYNKRG